MVRGEVARLLEPLTGLPETGRRWSGHASSSPEELDAAAEAARLWAEQRHERL